MDTIGCENPSKPPVGGTVRNLPRNSSNADPTTTKKKKGIDDCTISGRQVVNTATTKKNRQPS